jgi:predicted Zn-dependent protease
VRLAALTGLLAVALTLSACITPLAPIGATGQPFTPEDDERLLWAEAAREAASLTQRVRPYDDPELIKYLMQLADRLTPESAKPAGAPTVKVEVLRDPTLNAFALPDGRLFVHTGLLAAVESEAQLALLLAREIAHVVHRHGLGASRAGRLAPVEPPDAIALSPTAAAIVARNLRLSAVAAVSGWGPTLEQETDAVALAWLVRAGWDAQAAATVWALLAGDTRDPLETFLLGRSAWLWERDDSLRGLLEALEPAAAAEAVRTTEQFDSRLRPVMRDNAAEDIRRGRFALARRTLDRVLATNPADPLAHLDYGDLHRLQAQAVGQGAGTGDADQARARYTRALELDPTLAQAHRQLGLLYYEQKDLGRARAELEAYLAGAPGASDAARIAEYVRELSR